MNLIIELHDEDDIVHDKFRYTFDNQDTLEKLENLIYSKLHINMTHQELLSECGKRILEPGNTNLQSIGLKDSSKLIVKHCHLDRWKAYLSGIKGINNMGVSKPTRMSFANLALSYSKDLEDSGFFNAYPKFSTEWLETNRQLRRFVNGTEGALKQAATTFFSKMYPNSKKIDFKPKEAGSRAGIKVTITDNDEDINFYMKMYHSTGSEFSLENTSKSQFPAILEMFAYRLLEFIEVGPVVFFPYYEDEIYIHFIATKEVAEFKELDKIEDVNMRNKVVVEAYLLYLILGIHDLHEGNIGINKENNLSIVDFSVPDNTLRPDIFDAFMNKKKFGRYEKVNEILAQIGHEERMQIAKDALPRWSKINCMTSDIIDGEINVLREKHGLNDITRHVDYLEAIKSNYTTICLALQ
ncbi:unnamed protein product [Caenorhabditis angaria]|uniref:Ubiquitin-like domain-containing protein n=1 Tax=Caenorhabditis angaria TaxID=860376 RepID=A0A9P1MRY4_9PELO|nr:unnamed protein product [Caenorhabditis angaria]